MYLQNVFMNHISNKYVKIFLALNNQQWLICHKTKLNQTKRLEKQVDGNYQRILSVVLNKIWKQHSTKQLLYGHLPDICLCLPPDRTWHKVNDSKVDYSGDLREWKVGKEPRLEPCWTMPVIGPLSAMWTWWAWLDIDPNLGPGTYAWL